MDFDVEDWLLILIIVVLIFCIFWMFFYNKSDAKSKFAYTNISFTLQTNGINRKDFKKQYDIINIYDKIARDYNHIEPEEPTGESIIIKFGHYTPCQPVDQVEYIENKDTNIDIVKLYATKRFSSGIIMSESYNGDYSEKSIRKFIDSFVEWHLVTSKSGYEIRSHNNFVSPNTKLDSDIQFFRS